MQKKRRHHYVPAALSQGFCAEGSSTELFYYDVVEEWIRPASPKDVFVKTDFHMVELDVEKKDHNTIEDLLSEFEGKGILAIRRFVADRVVSQEDRSHIASFCGLQIARTPVMRAGVEQIIKERLQTTMRVLDESGQLPPLPASLRERADSVGQLLDQGVITVDILPQITMMSLETLPTTSQVIHDMNWCLIHSEDNNYFALSDNPCSIFDEDYERHGMGIGIGHPGVEFVMPLDRHHCLLAAWKPVPELMRANENHVKEFNKRTALFGERFFVFPIRSKRMMKIFMTYAGGQPGAECITIPGTGDDGGRGYYTLSSIRFTSERHHRLYLSLRPIFS